MNPETSHSRTTRRPGRRRPRGSARPGGASAQRTHAAAAPLLAPVECATDPVPFTTFGVDARLLEGIRDLGYAETRPVQSAVIPLALGGHDLIACAETGTGKTAAFVIPTLQRLIEQSDASADRQSLGGGRDSVEGKSRVLVLAPTRELAVQIEDEIHGLAYHTTVTSAAVYGGVEMGGQERALKAGVDIIVATPGRLMDHMRQRNADLTGIDLLVLDEADRMMDMGFWPDVKRIISALPTERQTLLFSATISDDVVRQAVEIVRDPKYVQVGQRSAPAKSISHEAHGVPGREKLQWLVDFLRRAAGPVLVFTRTKVGAERLARQLSASGIRAAALHADRTQDQRRAAVEGFRGGRHKVLVATDIAARGLDIDNIETVVNYEVPDSPEAYVHRVGRTGRADEAGRAITLVSPDERHAFAALEKSVGVRLE